MNHLVDIDITDKKVGLRVDLNVPIENGEILNHERLSAALPSILYILERTKKLCIISHLGRPEEGSFNENYSLEPIKNWFQKRLNVEIPLLSEFKNIPESLCLMENIRFFKGEKDNASQLSAMISNCFDVYVMDAFATAHRQSASTYGAILEAKEACAGLLFSQEIKSLDSALHNSENVLSIVGGSKVSTKLNVIKNLISNSSKVLVGGGIANTFLKAAGHEVGISLVEDEMIGISRKLLDTNKIILPKNVYVANSTQDNSAELVPVQEVNKNKMILDIELSEEVRNISNHKYIIWNGPLGIFEIEQFSNGTKQLINFLENSSSKVIAGGGETIYAISKFSDIKKFNYVSTAGGAFLEYLSGYRLPSIEALRLK
jgi:phosphoglycerate kinase